VSTPVSAIIQLLAREPSLDVTANLTATVDGSPIRIESYTDRVFANLPSIYLMWFLYDRYGSQTRSLAALLVAAGLTLVIQIDGRTVATIGRDAQSGPLTRLLAGDAVSVSLTGLVIAALSPW
jgi:uncharacterized protein (DUF3820 family)